MAKKNKKTTVQLLPLEYLLKIGRIKRSEKADYVSAGKGCNVYIPRQMAQNWKNAMNKDLEVRLTYEDGCVDINELEFNWVVKSNWIKP